MKKEYNSNEVINILLKLNQNKRFKKPKNPPLFTKNEVLFIADLIFCKPKDIIFIYIVDYIINKTKISGIYLLNGRNYKKYIFLANYFRCNGNATQAAILSGYSPKSAKQQAHRILRQIQKYSRLK